MSKICLPFFALLISLLLFGYSSFAQTASIDYFELQVNYSDSLYPEVNAVATINSPDEVDSLSFILTDSYGTILYSQSRLLNGWRETMPFREEEGMLYLTIAMGSFNSENKFASTILMKTYNGETLSISKP